MDEVRIKWLNVKWTMKYLSENTLYQENVILAEKISFKLNMHVVYNFCHLTQNTNLTVLYHHLLKPLSEYAYFNRDVNEQRIMTNFLEVPSKISARCNNFSQLERVMESSLCIVSPIQNKSLFLNHKNPFSPRTNIWYESLNMFNLQRRVSILLSHRATNPNVVIIA